MDRNQEAVGEAYVTDHELIIAAPGAGLGWTIPAEHNCDAMGCGQWHVLYRGPIPAELTSLKGGQRGG